MDRYRLKRIIILILVLVNFFLLGSLGQRRSAEHRSYRTAVEQLISLLAADGISVSSEIIPSTDPPAVRNLARSPELDHQAAAFLLGEPLEFADQGGGIFTYSGENGAALFRSNGSFEAAGVLCAEDSTLFCRNFSRKFGYTEPDFQLDQNGTGTATAVRRRDRLSVFNCTVTFTIAQGAVVAVNGTLLPDTSVESIPDTPPLSALAALNAFQLFREETGAVVTEITDIHLCYELQSTTAVPLLLAPAWCICTDTAEYYVNSLTGTVRSY